MKKKHTTQPRAIKRDPVRGHVPESISAATLKAGLTRGGAAARRPAPSFTCWGGGRPTAVHVHAYLWSYCAERMHLDVRRCVCGTVNAACVCEPACVQVFQPLLSWDQQVVVSGVFLFLFFLLTQSELGVCCASRVTGLNCKDRSCFCRSTHFYRQTAEEKKKKRVQTNRNQPAGAALATRSLTDRSVSNTLIK